MKRWLILSILAVAAVGGALYVRKRILSNHELHIRQALQNPRAKELDAEVGRRQRAVADNPADVKARWALADMYQKIGLLDLAADELAEIVKLRPDDPRALIALADTSMVVGRTDAAAKAYETITKRWPKEPQGWQGLSAAEYHRGEYRNAIQAIRKAIELEPKNQNHRYILCTSILQAVNESPTPVEYAPLLLVARNELLKLQKTWRFPGEIHYRLGTVAALLTDSKSAIAHYRKALELMPDRADVVAQLTDNLMTAGKRDEALKVVEAGINKGLVFAPLFDLQGRLLQGTVGQESREKILAAFKKAVELDPDNPRYLERLGGELARANRLDEARKALERAAILNPERAFPYQQLSAVYTRLGDLKRAASAAKMATQMVFNEQQLRRIEEVSLANPESVPVQLILADRYRELGRTGPAQAKYLLVLKLDPNNKRAKEGLKKLKSPPAVAAKP